MHPKTNNLNILNIDELVDILSEQTSLYLEMHSDGASEKELRKCLLSLEAVQAEIKSRRDSKFKQD